MNGLHWLAAALLAVATAPVVAATVQDDFTLAQKALDAGDYASARDRFTTLLSRVKPDGRSAGLVQARLGSALVALGDLPRAIALLQAALPAFGSPTAEDRAELLDAQLELGRAQELHLDLDAARRSYQAGRVTAAQIGEQPAGLRLAIARTALFDDPALARATLDEVLAGDLSVFAKRPEQLGELYSLRGRIELNDGQLAAAQGWFERALKTAGGLGTKVSLADLRIRGDLAMVHHLRGDRMAVAKYVAYTGAGGLDREGFAMQGDFPLPSCGPQTALRPEDVAIVELAMSSDGRVIGATTIYANRRGGPETLFAKAARGWSWRPSVAAKIEPFWRSALRVEMRCVTGNADAQGSASSMRALVQAWLETKRATPFATEGPDAASLPRLRAEMARREAAHGAHSLEVLVVLLTLDGNNAVDPADRAAFAARAETIALKAGAPVDVATFLAANRIGWTESLRRSFEVPAKEYDALLLDLERRGAGDSLGANWLRLGRAERLQSRNDRAGARALLQRIVATPVDKLPVGEAIRQSGLLRLASLEAADQQLATADALVAATGLTPAQCALVDVQPLKTRGTVSSNDFPALAQSWGTGGYIKLGYDIDGSGKPLGVRTVIAIPPFIFNDGTEKAVARFRFEPIYRGGETPVGCVGRQQGVNYRIAVP